MRQLAIGGLILLALIAAPASQVQRWDVRANEYFGDGVMWIYPLPTSPIPQSGIGEGKFVGIIKAWGWYAIHGTAEDCRITPIWSPVGDAAKVPCGMVLTLKQNRFSGWYDFRGHPRPFCGTLTDQFPQKCFGE